MQKIYKNGRDFAIVSLLGICNYLAAFSFLYLKRAKIAMARGNRRAFVANIKKSNAFASWGILPCTIINLAILYFFIVWLIKFLQPIAKQFGFYIP